MSVGDWSGFRGTGEISDSNARWSRSAPLNATTMMATTATQEAMPSMSLLVSDMGGMVDEAALLLTVTTISERTDPRSL